MYKSRLTPYILLALAIISYLYIGNHRTVSSGTKNLVPAVFGLVGLGIGYQQLRQEKDLSVVIGMVLNLIVIAFSIFAFWFLDSGLSW